jgi:hypothetical protein
MQMIVALLLTLSPLSAFSAQESLLSRAQKIMRPGDDYRLIQGSGDECPGEGTVFWRTHAGKLPYLMLTPSEVLLGFQSEGRVREENRGSNTECSFEREIKVSANAIEHFEYEVCKDPTMNREFKRVLTQLPENKIKYEVFVTWTGKAKSKTFTKLSCQLVRKAKKPGGR